MARKNIDAILIQPRNISPYKINHLPYGPLFIASRLKRAGYGVMIFDDRFDDRKTLARTLEENRVLIAGFSVFTGPIISSALDLGSFIKRIRPELPIVWGGPHPTILPEQTVENETVDIACRGEGDYVMLDLIKAIKEDNGIGKVKGITYREQGKIITNPDSDKAIRDWDKEVSMDLGMVDLRNYIFNYKGLDSIFFIASKGCPFRCSFCWNTLCAKRTYKSWSSGMIEEQLQPILKAGVKRILMMEAFMGPVRRVVEIGELFKKLGLVWSIEDGFRVDVHNDEKLFETLKKTNCHHVSFGAESGSQRMLDIIRKDTKVEQILESAILAKKHGIGSKYSWMIGIPGETRKDALLTVGLIDKIKKIYPTTAHSMSLYSPYPGSDIFDEVVRRGWVPPDTLEKWAYFREEMNYPYMKDAWYFKSIMYSNFLLHAINSENAIWKQTKPFYYYLLKALSVTANIRWKTRAFGAPIEYYYGEKIRKRVKGIIEK